MVVFLLRPPLPLFDQRCRPRVSAWLGKGPAWLGKLRNHACFRHLANQAELLANQAGIGGWVGPGADPAVSVRAGAASKLLA
ncbi:hypothetical protein STSO111631_15760 [Stackebrandtia soli]